MFPGDITEQSVCEQIVNETISKLGRIDILFNNAGTLHLGLMEDSPMENFDSIMNLNLRSAVMLTRLCMPHLKTSKGVVINNSSTCGKRAVKTAPYYCMSKAALDMLTKCLALELAPSGVRVNTISPGIVDTPIYTTIGLSQEAIDGLLERSKTTHLLGRSGTVEETANVIAFLASEESAFMTGTINHVSGGLQCNNPLNE